MDSVLIFIANAANKMADTLVNASMRMFPAKFSTIRTEHTVKRDSQERADMRLVEHEIGHHHPEYSECMADIFTFYNKYGKIDAPVLFREGLKKKPIDGEIGRINNCRDITKDWWRVVAYWDGTYGVFAADKDRRGVYRRRHDRFVPLVRPLEGTLPNEEDAYLFDFKFPKD
jgi:hypothetical protein